MRGLKVVVIHGSPRKGNTYAAAQFFMSTMREQGVVQFTEFFLPQDMPEFCRGCGACIVKGEDRCPHAKYIKPIVQAMDDADAFVLTTPVYVLQISGGLKAFLDHLAYTYINHRPRFLKQKAVIIATTAGAGLGNCLKYLSQNLSFWGVNKIYKVGVPMLAADWDTMAEKRRAKAREKLAATARLFYDDLRSGKVHPPSLTQSMMFRMSKSLMNSYDDSSVDKAYWRKKGWMLPSAQYFSPEFTVGPVSWAIGKLASLLFDNMMKADKGSSNTKPAPNPVYVMDYDVNWPEIFSSLKKEIAPVLGEVAIAIEHVGSTSVPGLAAKPVIDMNIVVRRDDVPQAIELLASLGYVHVGNQGIVDREAFKFSSAKPAHHLYVCPEDSVELQRHIFFRDYLRANPDVAQEYGELKKKLAEQYRNDRVAYTDAKTEFIAGVMQKAMTEKKEPIPCL